MWNFEKTAMRGDKFVIAITGKLSEKRSYFEDKIKEAGQIFGTSITGNTDYLVVGSKPGSKVQKAEAAGVKIIKEEEFTDLLDKLAKGTVQVAKTKMTKIRRLVAFKNTAASVYDAVEVSPKRPLTPEQCKDALKKGLVRSGLEEAEANEIIDSPESQEVERIIEDFIKNFCDADNMPTHKFNQYIAELKNAFR